MQGMIETAFFSVHWQCIRIYRKAHRT